MAIAAAIRTIPLALWLAMQLDTLEMEPLDLARVIVTANHLTVRDLTAHTVNGLGLGRKLDAMLLIAGVGTGRLALHLRLLVQQRLDAFVLGLACHLALTVLFITALIALDKAL